VIRLKDNLACTKLLVYANRYLWIVALLETLGEFRKSWLRAVKVSVMDYLSAVSDLGNDVSHGLK
jgi:hypothetical protein